MTVLVDTSVWSLSLRKDGPANHPAAKKLQSLLLDTQNIVLIGIILQEILQGFKHEGAYTKGDFYQSYHLSGCLSLTHLKPP